MWSTARLSVSARGLDCDEVAAALRAAGIAASVTPNHTVQCNRTSCWRENGCRVLHSFEHKPEVARLWDTLRSRFGLGCAHLSIPGQYHGCVLDFLRPSGCPGGEPAKK